MPSLTPNCKPIFGPIWSFLGNKSLFFTGEIKSFVTHITENPPRHLFHIVFWSGIGQNVQKWQYLAKNDQKCIFWTKFGRFWAKNPKFLQVSKSFGTHTMEKPPRQFFRIVFWSGIRSNGPKMPIFGQIGQFLAKFGRFWARNPIFWGQGVKILVPSYRDSNETPFSC